MEVNIMVIKRNKKLLGFMLALATLSPLSAQAAGFMDGLKTGYKTAQTTNAPSRSALTTSKNRSTAQTPSTTQNMAGGISSLVSANPLTSLLIVVSVVGLVSAYITYKCCKGRINRAEEELRLIQDELREAERNLQTKERSLQIAIAEKEAVRNAAQISGDQYANDLARARVDRDTAQARVRELKNQINQLHTMAATTAALTSRKAPAKKSKSWSFFWG